MMPRDDLAPLETVPRNAASVRPLSEGAAGRGIQAPPAVALGLLALAIVSPILFLAMLGFGSTEDGAFAAPDLRLWPCLVTGTIAALLSAWIWVLRPGDRAVWLFGLGGIATYCFCLGAAVLLLPSALHPAAYPAAMFANVVGASGFGLAMIALFSLYPRRFPDAPLLIGGSVILFGGWTMLSYFGPLELFIEIHRITLAEMVVILLLAGAQIWVTRDDAVANAIAAWLGACVAIGAGGFIALVALPSALMHAPFIPNEFGFLFFVIIYCGLAVALLRHRVFGLGRWAFQLLFIVGAGLALLAADAAMIVLFALDPARATGLALLFVALLYLPARAWLWQRFVSPVRRDQALLFRDVVAVALEPTRSGRARAWRDLLRTSFVPLEVMPAADIAVDPQIEADGRELYVPGSDEFAALRLRDRNGGRSLFSPEDAQMVRELAALTTFLGEARIAYDRGGAAERTRIAQDIHDNIGAQLLTALHASASERKNELIRETIGDLRDVIRNAEGAPLGLDALLADLRAETADRADIAGVDLLWTMAAIPSDPPPRATMRTLRSLLREAVSNALRHSSAGLISIDIRTFDGRLHLTIEDNGCGFDVASSDGGRGLGNMRQRTAVPGACFSLSSGPTGTRIEAELPIE